MFLSRTTKILFNLYNTFFHKRVGVRKTDKNGIDVEPRVCIYDTEKRKEIKIRFVNYDEIKYIIKTNGRLKVGGWGSSYIRGTPIPEIDKTSDNTGSNIPKPTPVKSPSKKSDSVRKSTDLSKSCL